MYKIMETVPPAKTPRKARPTWPVLKLYGSFLNTKGYDSSMPKKMAKTNIQVEHEDDEFLEVQSYRFDDQSFDDGQQRSLVFLKLVVCHKRAVRMALPQPLSPLMQNRRWQSLR